MMRYFMFFLVIAIISACNSSYEVQLPNNYSMSNSFSGDKVTIYKNKKVVLTKVMGFMVHHEYVYGWSSHQGKGGIFFLLNTHTEDLYKFTKPSSFETYLRNRSIPELEMNREFSFWDLKNGRQKKNW